MEEKNQPRRPRRSPEENTQKNESLVYGKNPVTELLKSGSGVDTVLLAEGMAPAVAAYYTAMAKEAGATVKRVHPNKLRLMTGTESHQGVAAFASEIEYATVEDLLAAAKGEKEEWDVLYREFAKVAEEEGFMEIATAFKMISTVEAEHERRYLKLLSRLTDGNFFKRDGKIWWQCRNCGFVIEAEEAPKLCPACKHPQAYFEVKKSNY